MGLTFRFRYWSIIQVIIIATCSGKKVSSEIVQGCVGSQLSLGCPELKVIRITAVVLGDSGCYFTSCCTSRPIKEEDCTYIANTSHRTDVRRRCDNKHNCTVTVFKEKIPCGWWESWPRLWPYNDFERITYDCMDNPQNDTMNNSTHEDTMEDNNSTDSKSGFVTEIAQGCVGSQLSLRCEEMKVIRILDVVIGYLNGVRTVCNISDSNCIHDANVDHTMDVHRRCDNQSNCTVGVIHEKINCGALNSLSQSDFELVAYNCLNDSRTTDGTVKNISSTKEAGITNSKDLVLIVVLSIICPIILLVIIVLVVVIYRRRERERVKKLLDPVAMTEVDNRQNEVDVNKKETHNGNNPLPQYSIIKRQDEVESLKTDKYPVIYSEVELRETFSKDGQSDRATTDKFKAATETHTTKPDVYAAVNKPTGTVSKVPTPQDDDGQTLIENDLYGTTDNSAQEITPTYLLGGIVSKAPSSQEDEGLTVIENDLYCH